MKSNTLLAESGKQIYPTNPAPVVNRCCPTTNKSKTGFTLVELMIVGSILAVLATIGVQSYRRHINDAKSNRSIADIKVIELKLQQFYAESDVFPNSLNNIGMQNLSDPWGNPYRYANAAITPPGLLRKDHFMVPVNTDFDLYSMGKDGRTASPFPAAKSQDDIVRANNGAYVGLVSEF